MSVKELVIISGKGGTGKTSVAAAFAHLLDGAIYADCDVDAANLGLILKPKTKETHEFKVSKKALLDQSLCTKCGLCEEICRFDAIIDFKVNPVKCEGCAFCAHICPQKAIRMEDVVSGSWSISETRKGPLVHARLKPGEANSGKLVSLVRQKARYLAEKKGLNFILTDGPPGIGCPVIASLTGASMALAVTEPSLSGIHDLERVASLCDRFKVSLSVVVNKWDIDKENTYAIFKKCEALDIFVAGTIPYDENVPKAAIQGSPITETSSPAGERVKKLWFKVSEMMGFATGNVD